MFIFKINNQFFKSIKAIFKYIKNFEHGTKKFLLEISIIKFFN